MRSQRFYRRNEQNVMRGLGFEPTPNSGSGWIIKEDGQTEHTIAQLKSTDAESIRINLNDINILERNAAIAHKRPIFVVQFLQSQEIFLVIRPDDDIMEVLQREIKQSKVDMGELIHNVENSSTISTSDLGRTNFYNERESTRNEQEIQRKNGRKIRGPFGKEKSKRRLDPELPI